MTEKHEKAPLHEEQYNLELRNGVWIFILLDIFTVGEFIAAILAPTLVWFLIIVALPKVFFVVTEYMHIQRVFLPEEEDHS